MQPARNFMRVRIKYPMHGTHRPGQGAGVGKGRRQLIPLQQLGHPYHAPHMMFVSDLSVTIVVCEYKHAPTIR